MCVWACISTSQWSEQSSVVTHPKIQGEIGGEEMKGIIERGEKTEVKRTCQSVTHSAGVSILTSSADNTLMARTRVCVSVCVFPIVITSSAVS